MKTKSVYMLKEPRKKAQFVCHICAPMLRRLKKKLVIVSIFPKTNCDVCGGMFLREKYNLGSRYGQYLERENLYFDNPDRSRRFRVDYDKSKSNNVRILKLEFGAWKQIFLGPISSEELFKESSRLGISLPYFLKPERFQ